LGACGGSSAARAPGGAAGSMEMRRLGVGAMEARRCGRHGGGRERGGVCA
jgi:hypothetical protein